MELVIVLIRKPRIKIINFLNRAIFSSLTRRIVTLNLTALTLLLLGIVYIENSYNNLINNKFASMQIQANIISDVLASINNNFSSEKTVNLFSKLALDNNLQLRIYDDNGKFLFDSAIEDKNNIINAQQLYEVLQGTPQFWKNKDNRKYLELNTAVPILTGDKIIGVLQLIDLGNDIEKTVKMVNIKVLLFTILISNIFLFLSLYLAYTIANPLRRLSIAAKQASKFKNPPTILPQFLNRYDEIDSLAKAIQRMTQAFYSHLEVMESFAQDVSHELKNPLASINSALETLKIVSNVEQREVLENIIINDVNRMNLLITDIADVSRIDAELARDSYGYIDIGKMVKNRVAIAKTLHNDKNINFVICEKTSMPIIVQGHELRLAQIFDNLLMNASSFVPNDNAEIKIILNIIKDKAQIIVEDNGIGIKAKKLEDIFKRFYTERVKKNNLGANSGLGLTIVKQIVEAHKGTIKVENIINTNENRTGARFIIILPKAK